MYEKVRIENYQLIRESDGSLIATCCFPLLDPGLSDYEKDGKLIPLLYGFVDKSGN